MLLKKSLFFVGVCSELNVTNRRYKYIDPEIKYHGNKDIEWAWRTIQRIGIR